MKRERNAKDQKTAKSQTKSVRQVISNPHIVSPAADPHHCLERESHEHPVPGLQTDFPPDHQGSCVCDSKPQSFANAFRSCPCIWFLANMRIRAAIASSSTPPTSTARVSPIASPVSAHRKSPRWNRTNLLYDITG